MVLDVVGVIQLVRELGDIGHVGLRVEAGLDGTRDAVVDVVLNERLHFVIPVEVDGVPCQRDFILLLKRRLELLDDEFNLDPSIGRKHICRVYLVDFKCPICDHDYFRLEVSNVDRRVLGLKIIDGFSCEVTNYEEKVICYQEVWERLFYKALDLLLGDVLR